mmetsp:Transcript_13484/g.38656  ORF Transcript_13484/g.38656 Transcript_13484/m.38656 type:complete len:206 (+) Transcript_13484:272-889(+)
MVLRLPTPVSGIINLVVAAVLVGRERLAEGRREALLLEPAQHLGLVVGPKALDIPHQDVELAHGSLRDDGVVVLAVDNSAELDDPVVARIGEALVRGTTNEGSERDAERPCGVGALRSEAVDLDAREYAWEPVREVWEQPHSVEDRDNAGRRSGRVVGGDAVAAQLERELDRGAGIGLIPTSHVLFDVDRSERLRNGRRDGEREQ